MARAHPTLITLVALGAHSGCSESSTQTDDTRDATHPTDVATNVAAPDTTIPTEASDVATPDADAATEGCDACWAGCCGGACCALVPSQEAIVSLGDGQGTFTIDQAVAFDTGTDCGGETLIGACEHLRIAEEHVVCVCRLAALTITGRLTVTGSDALVVLARDGITIDGTLDVSARGARSGPGGGWAYVLPSAGREGGKGGSFASVGGGDDEALGDDGLEPLTAGCRGQGTSAEPELGGGRGGGLQLSAGRAITIAGSVLAHGGGGGGGSLAGGGGGGSGGAILIEAPSVVIRGVVAAHGGGGGGAAGDGGAGTAGEDGQHERAADGGEGKDGSGCDEHGRVSGGDGGAGAFGEADATMGEAGASELRCGGAEAWVGGGGGGGGLGRIRIRSLTPCDCSGLVAPAPRIDEAEVR